MFFFEINENSPDFLHAGCFHLWSCRVTLYYICIAARSNAGTDSIFELFESISWSKSDPCSRHQNFYFCNSPHLTGLHKMVIRVWWFYIFILFSREEILRQGLWVVLGAFFLTGVWISCMWSRDTLLLMASFFPRIQCRKNCQNAKTQLWQAMLRLKADIIPGPMWLDTVSARFQSRFSKRFIRSAFFHNDFGLV